MTNKETRSIVAELRVAKADDGTRSISGLIPYNKPSDDLGGYREIIAPGAFASAFESGADVLALRDHDPRLLLGRTKSGTLTLVDTDEGLRYTVKLPNTTVANDLAESVDRQDLDSTSFGFVCQEATWAATEDEVVRTLMQVDLIEVSPCSFAAYPDAAVSLRSAPAEIRSTIEARNAPPVSEPVVPPVPTAKEDPELRNYMHMRVTVLTRQ